MTPLQGVLLALTGVAALLIALLADGTVEGREGLVYLPGSVGDVVFDHDRHAGEADNCVGCHHHSGSDSGEPETCRDCHPAVQDAKVHALGCDECHDFTAEEAGIEHDDLFELHPDCDMCHQPRAVATAYHEQCTACHAEIDSERFLDEDGLARCGWCHL